MNVAYDTVAFEVLNVSLTFTPDGPLASLMTSISDILGMHGITADILKLIGTPTCASKQPVGGIIVGANPHIASPIT